MKVFFDINTETIVFAAEIVSVMRGLLTAKYCLVQHVTLWESAG